MGDEVRYNDQIKFESVKTEGQFLHCSASEYGNRFTVLQDRYECLSTQGARIRLYFIDSTGRLIQRGQGTHLQYCSGLVHRESNTALMN